MINPFTPSFGRIPPVLAGRDLMVNEMVHALEQASSAPDLCTLYTGPRGVGKTALMLRIAELSGELGWVPATTTAGEGMLEDLFEQALLNASEFVDRRSGVRLKSLGLGGIFKAEWEYRSESSGNWRTRMGKLLSELAEYDVGLLMTIDEVKVSIPEMIQLVNTVQHFFGERRKVALLLAGLPGNVSALVAHERASFLRRAVRRDLGLVQDADVGIALRSTVESSGRRIADDALGRAVEAIGGYPYMMQLVGYRSWDASAGSVEIALPDVEAGIGRARADFKNGVLDATYRSLSAKDREFLFAMLEDGECSTIADVAARMGKDATYARTYRERLLDQGLIIEPDRGLVAFGMPFLREYLEGLRL